MSLIELVPGQLWTNWAPMSVMGLPLGRRCAIARNAHGELVVFSPLEGSAPNLESMRRLGKVAAFVVPSRLHDRYFDGYFSHFPGAKFLGSSAVRAENSRWPLVEITPEHPQLDGFRFTTLAGMPRVQEQVFLHESTGTLLLADALFNIPEVPNGLGGMLMKLAGIGGEPRPSRLFQKLVKDRQAFAASLREVLSWNFDRIVPGHGDVIERSGKEVIRRAYRGFLAE
jgi:hypothetical protein